MDSTPLPVIDRSYELVKWFLNHLAKFPRSHRYGLGKRIEDQLYGVFEAVTRAQYSRGEDKCRLLEAANLDLEILRFLCRMAHELRMLPHGSHEYAVRELDEIGRMIGGWIRHQKDKKGSSPG